MTEAGQVRCPCFYIVAEKIVVGDEELQPSWPIEGTTGYGFLNFLNGLFVDGSKKREFARRYARFTGWSESFDDTLYQSKQLIVKVSMASELRVLSWELDRISEQHRWSRDFTHLNLREALAEVVACFPVYRTYIRAGQSEPDAESRRHVLNAISCAKRRNPALSESVFDFIQSVLLLEPVDRISAEQQAERRHFVLRWQQFTGPVMAKSLEDTTFYRYFPLASLNEVGGNPKQFGVPMDFFHTKNLIRLSSWPHAMLTTSTHDTKRGEDVRARLNLLSEVPTEWFHAIRIWQELNKTKKSVVSGAMVPTPNDEYLLYQTLVGVWPFQTMDTEDHRQFVARIQDYMKKATREAKLFTSWVSPNQAYENAVHSFVAGILERSPENTFLTNFLTFQNRIARAGVYNSLAQVLIKITAPGVPDLYQGNELWNLTLVDPDNRRPVDYAVRRDLLRRLRASRNQPLELVERLLNDPGDGAIKLYVTHCALEVRKVHRELFAKGSYLALRAAGKKRNHVLAFARRLGTKTAIVLAGRLFMQLGADRNLPVGHATWGDSAIMLRKGASTGGYVNVLTGQELSPEQREGRWVLPLAHIFSRLPVALLTSVETP
jgi:(1->4)-alpha-D-glucan 1-alpha-D-glucosylmutase